MKPALESLCNDFVENRDILRKSFKLEHSLIYPVCANIFCVKGIPASEEKLRTCKALLKDKTGVFSHFRGTLTVPLISFLATSSTPEAKLEQALSNYTILKNHFFGTSYLALISFLITDLGNGVWLEEKAARGKAIYQKMKKEHPFLTSSEDSVFAVLMAFSDKSDEELITEMETCYHALKNRFSSSNHVQSVSHILCMAGGNSAERSERVIELYDAIRAAGGKYGKYHHLSSLAALSLAEADIPSLVEDILAIDEFLSSQKGYGALGADRRTRMMHAAMLLTSFYFPDKDDSSLKMDNLSRNASSMAGTLAVIAAQQAAMCVIICASASSASSASS